MLSHKFKKKKNKKYIENIQHPKNLLINRGFSILLLNRLAPFKWMGLILDELDPIIIRSNLSVALKVRGGIVCKQLVDIFGVNGRARV